MNSEETSQGWRGKSEEIISGMTEWRQQHAKATFREIEEELDRRLSELQARMLADMAVASARRSWEAGEKPPVCEKCGARLAPSTEGAICGGPIELDTFWGVLRGMHQRAEVAGTGGRSTLLEGRTGNGTVGLAPSMDNGYSGTHWQITIVR